MGTITLHSTSILIDLPSTGRTKSSEVIDLRGTRNVRKSGRKSPPYDIVQKEMKAWAKISLPWIIALLIIGIVIGVASWLRHRTPLVIKGAVTVGSGDSRKEVPVSDVEVSIADDVDLGTVKSDASGYFNIKLPLRIRRGHSITLKFRHPDYMPMDQPDYVSDRLYVVHLAPRPRPPVTHSGPETPVANIKVRYSVKNFTVVSVGSAVKTFQVENVGNVPCKNQAPCSPDGMWKAHIGSTTLDAGPGNEFRNGRVSCIAGPCPFTRIEQDGFSHGGQVITVSARNWSDTATFLMEAEVFHPMASQIVHQSYPVIFGPTLNFTLPADAEGICIIADLKGETIIFPIGPSLSLGWASCNARTNPDHTKVYRCELKPGFKFP